MRSMLTLIQNEGLMVRQAGEGLDQLQAGDEVTVFLNYGAVEVHKIDRVTKTQIVIGGWKFRKKDGFRIGNVGWHTAHIELTTEEHRSLSRRKKLILEVHRLVEWANRQRLKQMTDAELTEVKVTLKMIEDRIKADDSE